MDKSGQYVNSRWLLLVAVSVGYVGGCAMVVSIAPLLERIAVDLKIDIATANNFMMTATIFSVMGLVVGGFLADRCGVFALLVSGHLCAAVPSLVLPWIGETYHAVLAVRLFQGASVGFLMCLMAPIVGGWFPPRQRGIASGIMGMSVSIGFGVGAGAGPALAAALGSWQQMVACFSAFNLAGLALTLVLLAGRRSGSASRPEVSAVADKNAFQRALASRVTWVGISITFFAQWSMQTVQLVMPSYLALSKPVGAGFGPASSGGLMLVFMAAGIVGPIIAGVLQDKVFQGNPKPVMLMGFILCTFIWAIAFPLVSGSAALVGVTLVLVGIGTQLIFPCIAVYVSSVYPLGIAGKMVGLWFGLGAIGAIAGLGAVKITLAAYGSYTPTIPQIALSAVFGLALVPFLAKPAAASDA